jgi:hypothetical protein
VFHTDLLPYLNFKCWIAFLSSEGVAVRSFLIAEAALPDAVTGDTCLLSRMRRCFVARLTFREELGRLTERDLAKLRP